MSVIAASRRLLGDAYRKIAAPFGARAVERMLREGLPPRLGPPLRVLFSGHAPPEAEDVARRIERLRADLATRADTYRFTSGESKLGPARWPERGGRASASRVVTSRVLANIASVPRRWGMFLHLCAQSFEARAILELGTCLGISGAYLASVPSRPRLVTLEGSTALASLAETMLAAMSCRADVVRGPFENTLQGALHRVAAENLAVNVAYIDGHHDEAATLHYVRTVVEHLSSEALVVLDDIHLCSEMWRAWRRLASMPGVAAAVNVGRFGLLVWRGGDATPAGWDLSRYTGRWRVGGSRREAMGRFGECLG